VVSIDRSSFMEVSAGSVLTSSRYVNVKNGLFYSNRFWHYCTAAVGIVLDNAQF
jgi:hypothetical protein